MADFVDSFLFFPDPVPVKPFVGTPVPFVDKMSVFFVERGSLIFVPRLSTGPPPLAPSRPPFCFSTFPQS